MYSVERLEAFQAYCDRTSVVRAVAVCLLTPLPPLLVTVLLECIPLRNPDEGWKANYMFWIRFFISGVVVNLGLTYQLKDMVHQLDLSALRCLWIAGVSIAVYVLTVMAVASTWVFPVPFGIILGVGPCFAVYLCVLFFTIGRKTLANKPSLCRDLTMQLYVMGVQAVLITIYPAFNGLYHEVSSTQRAGLVLLLPVTKLVMKNVVAWTCSHLEEFVPVVAVFSVEIFNALYVATCMQSSNSTVATFVIIGLDAVHAAMAFQDLELESRSIQHQQMQLLGQTANAKYASENTLKSVLATCQGLDMFRTARGKLIRVSAPIKLSISAVQRQTLDRLAARQKTFADLEARRSFEEREEARTCGNSSVGLPQGNSTRVGPSEQLVPERKGASTKPLSREEKKLELVESTLGLLFRCEYLALVEYVECAVPILYGAYVTILCQLPTHEFYPHTRDMTSRQLESTLKNLCMYIAMEMVSFVVLHTVVRKKVGLPSLYQLAFVLETQAVQLQSRLFVWIVFILQFTLQHYGVDFTFRFEWIK